MRAVWKREMQSYFKTPIGYVFMGFFLMVGGLMFFFSNMASGSGNLVNLLSQFTVLLMFLIPILTMRLFSEERRNKSEQLLLTSPLSLKAIVAGKFLAAAAVFLLTLAITGLYILIVGLYGRIYWGEVLTAYLGFFLMGCCFISVGVLVSSMTENQVSAAAATFGINFFLWVIDAMVGIIPSPWVADILSWLSVIRRYDAFARAQLGFSGTLYFVSFCAVFLFLTVRVIDKRRWSEG
ncbi:MAG: ABC transporter permease subunit [Clostridia bacterium]|nr:ABC transporter permease subunit [Clostridia bacterium]